MADSTSRGIEPWRQSAYDMGRQLARQQEGRSKKQEGFRRQVEHMPDGTILITEEYVMTEETEWWGGGDSR